PGGPEAAMLTLSTRPSSLISTIISIGYLLPERQRTGRYEGLDVVTVGELHVVYIVPEAQGKRVPGFYADSCRPVGEIRPLVQHRRASNRPAHREVNVVLRPRFVAVDLDHNALRVPARHVDVCA